MYGADLAGASSLLILTSSLDCFSLGSFVVSRSLFTSQTTAWNVASLPSALSRLLPPTGKFGRKVPGVNTPYLYWGMWRATFAWHVEASSPERAEYAQPDAEIYRIWTSFLSTSFIMALRSIGMLCLRAGEGSREYNEGCVI